MPDENNGVSEVPVTGDDVMPEVVDLPPAVAGHLIAETVGNIQANNREGRDSAAMAQSLLRFVAARKHDEIEPAESRAVSGVLATPIAGPTTQQP